MWLLCDAALEMKVMAASVCAQQLVTRAVVAPNSHYEPEAFHYAACD
jgi:hypothetical protein